MAVLSAADLARRLGNAVVWYYQQLCELPAGLCRLTAPQELAQRLQLQAVIARKSKVSVKDFRAALWLEQHHPAEFAALRAGRTTLDLAMGRPARVVSVIYYLQVGGEGCPIKIGFTTDLVKRLVSFRSHNPGHCVLLASMPGTLAEEQAILRFFSDLCIHGEWFEAHPRLLDHIAQVKAGTFTTGM